MKITRTGQATLFILFALLFAYVAFRDFLVEATIAILLMAIAAEGAWVRLATRKPEAKFILTRDEVELGEHRVVLYPGDESVERVLLTKKVGGRVELESKVSFLDIGPKVVRGVGRLGLEFKFTTGYAGDYSGNAVGVTVTGPLGLFSSKSTIPFAQKYIVYPRVLQVAAATVRFLGKAEIGETPIEMPGVGSEYYEMRGYQPGDDFRNVNWKASAREGELVVVEHMKEVGSSFLLVLDTRAPGFSDTDRLASAFLSVANSLGAAGVNFGVLVHDGSRVTDLSSQLDPRASLSLALRTAARITKLDASPEFLELVPFRASRGATSGAGFADDMTLSQMPEVRREEIKSVLESVDPWATATRYLRETQTDGVAYVSGLFGEVQPLIELAWEARHYRDTDFAVANPCEAKTDEDRRGNQKLAMALRMARVRYYTGEPLDLTRRILAS